MPVMVFYKDRVISTAVAAEIAEEIAKETKTLLNAAIEVRVVEPVYSFNANEIHIEMQFRDLNDWDEKQLASYHKAIMASIENVLKANNIHCQYSFYIVPSQPPKSIWAQGKSA